MDPPGSEAFHTERLARLNRCLFGFSRPGCVVPEQKGGAQTGFTFASFNQLFKITGPLLRAWATIVSACAEARLLIVSRSLSDAEVRSAFLERCLRAGIGPARLELQGFVADPEAHNARLAGADVILDTFPYNGATTTCEALLLGVPVVALRGDSSAGRQGATILEASGLREFVAESTVEYVRIAQALYERRRTLPELRQMVRSRMKRSPVADGTSLARAIEEAQRAAFAATVPRSGPTYSAK
jgi:protein O-GlcNAc transferase